MTEACLSTFFKLRVLICYQQADEFKKIFNKKECYIEKKCTFAAKLF
jgi:hypothetical protein